MGQILGGTCCSNEDKIKSLYSTIKDQEDEIRLSRVKISQLEENSAMLIRNLEKELMNNGGAGAGAGAGAKDVVVPSSSSDNQDVRIHGLTTSIPPADRGLNGKSISESSITLNDKKNGSFNDKKSSDLTERMKKLAATMTDFRQRNSKAAFVDTENTPVSGETKNMRDFM